uniref:Uncharacterized protein n=1 Tax=Panagrolaimus sp. JU765 TaxID=591449 RepID=A0AC34QTN4_9BILA
MLAQLSPCFEPLCNTREPHKCYEGFVGDCEWIGIFKGQKSFPTPNACDRRQSQKDVCIRQRWTHVNETKRKCEFYQCRHTHVEHGIDFLGKNDSYCKNYTINDHHAEVCRCKGNLCFKPEEKEISCYLQLGESENGNLTKCPPYTTHCYYKRHNLTKAITTRKCSDSANIHLKCHTAENSIWEDCDCYGNACNDIHFKRQCITGVRGDCNDYDEFIGIKFHEPISTECHSWVEQSCFTTTIANGNGTCTVYSCERFWPNFINGSETGSDNCRSEGNVKECSCIGKDCQTADTSKKSSSMMKSLEMIVGILLILI